VSDGSDFASFVVARWPVLVRSLVLLGHATKDAEAAVESGLARCQPSWESVRDSGDVDAHVYRVVLDQVRHATASEHDDEGPPPLLDPMLPDQPERVQLLAELETALGRLPAELRTVLVLRFASGLDPDQVAAVLGVPMAVLHERETRGTSELASSADWDRVRADGFEPSGLFPDAAEMIPVHNPPVDAVLGRAAAARTRRRQWTVGIAAGVVVVLAVSTWLATRPTGPQLPESVVTEASNPANIEWYANQVLHLPEVTVEVPGVSELVEMPDGVVYGTADGLVAYVRGDGTLVKLGEALPGTRVVGSLERGWVAWVGPGEPFDRLVIHDVVRERSVASRSVTKGTRIVALDGDEVYYTTRGRDWSWQPLDGEPSWTRGGTLVDVASGVRVSQVKDERLRIEQPLFDVEVDVPGNGAILSDDGDYLLTSVDTPDPETVVLYDAASGEAVDVGLTRAEIAIQAAFDPDGAAAFMVKHRANEPEPGQELRLSTTGPTILRSCEFEFFEPECETMTQFAGNSGKTLLPH